MIKQPYNQYEPYTDVVYRLAGYQIRYPEDEAYPRFAIYLGEESIHRSFEGAKARIDEIAAIDSPYSKWHSFFIAEVPVGICCFNVYDGQRRWSFTGKGEFVAHKAIASEEDINGNREIYWGREKEDCRFKVGDVVEIFSGTYVELGMIWRLPIDFEYAKNRMPKDKPETPMSFHLDASDDNYIVVTFDGICPDHAEVIDCFPAETLVLDESLVARLQQLCEDFHKEVESNSDKE